MGQGVCWSRPWDLAMVLALASLLMTLVGESNAGVLLAPAPRPASDSSDLGQAKKSDAVVKVTAVANPVASDGTQVITVTLTPDTDRPWHIYANPLPKDLPGVATTIAIDSAIQPEAVRIDYPEGQLVHDPDFGDYRIYENTVGIKVTLRRARNDTGPLALNATFQACWQKDNKGQCLPQATVRVTLP